MVAHGERGFAALSQRRVGWAVGVAGRRDSLGSSSSWAWGFGFLAEHAGRERGKTFPSSPAARLGEEERGTLSLKRHFSCLFLSFFLFYNMKRRRFRQNVPFHLNETRRQNTSIYKSALNYLLFISIATFKNSIAALIFGCFFHFGPCPLIYAIEPSIDQ